MGIEYRKIEQRQDTRAILQSIIRNNFLAFDTDLNHLLYSRDGVSFFDFYNSGEIDNKFASLDASHITTGTIDPARIPVLPSQLQIVSSGNLTALTAPQQALIGQGTVVTTTDGWRWVYSGSGSKTLAASYTQLADITPDWSTISNKPTTLAGLSILVSDPLFDGKYLGISANAISATKLQTARLIAGVSFDGTANISIPYANLTSIPATFTPSAHTHIIGDTTGLQAALDSKLSIASASSTYQPIGAYITLSSVLTGYVVGTNTALAATDSILGALQKLQGQINNKQASGSYSLTTHNHDSAYLGINANAVSATKLATARTIAGVSFDGSANIAIPYSGLTGLPTLGTLAAKSSVTWTSDLSGVPTSVAGLGNSSVHGGLKVGNITVGGWHGIEFSDAQTTRILINDVAGGNICGFYDATNGWLMSFNRSKQLVDGWIPWARLQNVPSSFAPSAHTHLWAHITDKPTAFTPSAHNQAWSTITGTPTTLAAYGITDAVSSSDARLTDARTPINNANYVFGDNGTASRNITDFNAVVKSGFGSGQTATGTPGTGWYHIITNKYHGDITGWLFQIAAGFGMTAGPATPEGYYVRIKEGTSVPGAWRKLWHDGNFTPGNYLPLAGGTMSGNLLGSTSYNIGASGNWWGNGYFNDLYAQNNLVWHAGNFNPATKSDTSHGHTLASITGTTLFDVKSYLGNTANDWVWFGYTGIHTSSNRYAGFMASRLGEVIASARYGQAGWLNAENSSNNTESVCSWDIAKFHVYKNLSVTGSITGTTATFSGLTVNGNINLGTYGQIQCGTGYILTKTAASNYYETVQDTCYAIGSTNGYKLRIDDTGYFLGNSGGALWFNDAGVRYKFYQVTGNGSPSSAPVLYYGVNQIIGLSGSYIVYAKLPAVSPGAICIVIGCPSGAPVSSPNVVPQSGYIYTRAGVSSSSLSIVGQRQFFSDGINWFEC